MNKEQRQLARWEKINKVIVFAIVSPLAGTLMGYIGWKGLEKKYRNL